VTARRSLVTLSDRPQSAVHGVDALPITVLRMMKRILLLLLLFCEALGWRSQATAASTETDANIVTAIDISDSVSRADLDRLVAALATAVASPPVVAAMRSGPTGRIGFSVFAWHHYRYSYVDWMPIASQRDAEEAAARIRKRILVNAEPRTNQPHEPIQGHRTDISAAIDYAGKLLDDAPFAARDRIVNIVGNGIDNVGEPAGPARDRFTRTGGTINGLIFGDHPKVTDYYRHQVAGGSSAFVVTIAGGGDLADAFRRKFLSDIAVLQDRQIAARR